MVALGAWRGAVVVSSGVSGTHRRVEVPVLVVVVVAVVVALLWAVVAMAAGVVLVGSGVVLVVGY